MNERFQVWELPRDIPEVDEQLGSKRKFWFRQDGQLWLFKYARQNTGEDWAEKIAAEIAKLLELPSAEVELAHFIDDRGCASKSFVRQKEGVDLVHGSEVLAGRVFGYNKEKRWKQSSHSIANIIEAVEKTFPKKERDKQLTTFAGFLVFDALICNVDRHHDNWAFLRSPKAIHEVSPSYDHASSLGRELLDERRQNYIDTNQIEKYILNGHGGIYWDEKDSRGENPLKLAMKVAEKYPHYFQDWIVKVQSLHSEKIESIVKKVPGSIMSDIAKQFCISMMTITKRYFENLKL